MHNSTAPIARGVIVKAARFTNRRSLRGLGCGAAFSLCVPGMDAFYNGAGAISRQRWIAARPYTRTRWLNQAPKAPRASHSMARFIRQAFGSGIRPRHSSGSMIRLTFTFGAMPMGSPFSMQRR